MRDYPSRGSYPGDPYLHLQNSFPFPGQVLQPYRARVTPLHRGACLSRLRRRRTFWYFLWLKVKALAPSVEALVEPHFLYAARRSQAATQTKSGVHIC